MAKSRSTPCPLCAAPLGHPGVSCHFADTDALPLIVAGAAKAGDQKQLARTLHTTEEAICNAKARARRSGTGVVALPDQVRFDLVQYLLGEPLHPPPPAEGRQARFGAPVIVVWVSRATYAKLHATAWRDGGMRAIVLAAMERFVRVYGGKPRHRWPAYSLEKGECKVAVAGDDATQAFDLAVGGPGWRRYLVPVAIDEYLDEQERAAAKPAVRRRA